MGWVYNLHETDPNSEIPRVIGICLACSITAFLAVCLRFYVRIRISRFPWIDDYAALAGSLLTLAYAGIAVARESILIDQRRLTAELTKWLFQRRDGAKDSARRIFQKRMLFHLAGYASQGQHCSNSSPTLTLFGL